MNSKQKAYEIICFEAFKRANLKCLFCDKPQKWKTVISIKIRDTDADVFSVCPYCRKTHTIQQMFERRLSGPMIKLKKYLEEERMINPPIRKGEK